MNKQELIEKLIDLGMTFEQVQGLDIEELQSTYELYKQEEADY